MNLEQIILADGGNMEPGSQLICAVIILTLLAIGLYLRYRGSGRPPRK